MVKDIKPGAAGGVSATLGGLTNFNNTLYFAPDDGINGVELWTSDGTDAGTVMVKDIKAGDAKQFAIRTFSYWEYPVFFCYRFSAGCSALEKRWNSRRNSIGKRTQSSGNIGVGLSPFNFTLVNGDIFFVAIDALLNSVLWKTDGTQLVLYHKKLARSVFSKFR